MAANTARDVGGRLAAMTIYGMPAAGGKYAAIAALTNIPATLLAIIVYELLMTDSDRGMFYICRCLFFACSCHLPSHPKRTTRVHRSS